MRRNLLVAVVVGTGLSFTLWGASAAQNGSNRGGAAGGAEARIGLVDVAYIFKNYAKFTRLYNALKEEVRIREKDIADQQTELKTLMNQKQQLTPESPDFKKYEQRIVQLKGNLEISAESARREFTQKEANLYHQTYQEVENAVSNYAQRAGLTLVLRASRDNDSSTNNPQDVVKEVSQMVIYSLPNMDITQPILDTLNAQDAAVSGPKGTPGVKPGNQNGPTAIQKIGDKKGDEVRKPSGGTIKK